MENILFSNTPAEELNKLVRTKIAEHLFLICHYEPCVDVFSEDAKFVAGCLNLYKAVIDSSCIIRKLTKKGWLKSMAKQDNYKKERTETALSFHFSDFGMRGYISMVKPSGLFLRFSFSFW